MRGIPSDDATDAQNAPCRRRRLDRSCGLCM
jgi:hypothetical protein